MASGNSSTWLSYKQLLNVVNLAVFGRSEEIYHDLEALLRRHKPAFLTLAEPPPKNLADRDEVKNAATVGIQISAQGSPVKLNPSLTKQVLEVSDILDINEKTAFELMLVAEQQLPRFPDYSREQVAILLYHDGRQSVYSALRALVQAREGNTWILELSPQVIKLIMTFTDELFENGLVRKCLKMFQDLDPLKETERFRGTSAGDSRLTQEVTDLVIDQRNVLADTLFYWSCQQPFYSGEVLDIISHLKRVEFGSTAHLDHVGVALFSTLLQCFTVGDLLSWQQRNDDEPDERYPITSQYPGYIRDVHKEMMKPDSVWAWPQLGAAAKFSWSILLRECSKIALFAGTNELDDDDRLVVSALKGGGLKFLRESYVDSKHFQQEDLYSKRLHSVLMSFIVNMHLKVKEICYTAMDGDSTRPLTQQSGKHVGVMEDFLLLLGDLYSNEQLGEELSLDYWCVSEAASQAGRKHHSNHRQLSLLRFLHTCCDVLQGSKVPVAIFLAFLYLLRGLSNGQRSANYCHTFLSPSPSHGLGGIGPQRAGGVVSWDHFFMSMKQYYAVLRQDSVSTRNPISPSELAGLQAVLQLTQTIANKDEMARVALFENQAWSVPLLLFGLVGCSVPCLLKAEVFRTLAAFAKTPEMAAQMWPLVEQSQVVQGIPATSTPKSRTTPLSKQQGFTLQHAGAVGNIQIELEEVESKEGDYSVTRGFLLLLDTLLEVPLPPGLGHPHRTPGFDPYLSYLVDGVFMKFDSRSYRDPMEKWKVAASVLEILHKLLKNYNVNKEDFIRATGDAESGTKHPGFTLLIHMMKESKFMRKVLQVLEHCVKLLEDQTSVNDPPDVNMERTVLLCLKMLETTLEKQDAVLEVVRGAGGGVRVESVDPLHHLLLHVSGTPQQIINIIRCVSLFQCSPELALSAVKILQVVATYHKAVADLIYGMTSDQNLFKRVLHSFVERLEVAVEGSSSSSNAEDTADPTRDSLTSATAVQEEIKINILRLLLLSVDRPAPNLAHLLLGYNVDSKLSQTELQNPGVMGCSYTLLHSVLGILRPAGKSLSFANLGTLPSSDHSQQLKELAYCLLYNLCCHGDVAGPTLRYLRHSFDFFCEHLKMLPFRPDSSSRVIEDELVEEMRSSQPHVMNSREVAILRQQAWFLKTLAIELRITAKKCYFSQTNQLLSLLLSDLSTNQMEGEEVDQMGLMPLPFAPRVGVVSNSGSPCVSTLLAEVDFSELDFPFQLQLQHFEMGMIEQLIPHLQNKDPLTGVVQVNIRRLHHLLLSEVNLMQGASVEQRMMLMKEIHHILTHFVAKNVLMANVQARCDYFEGWRQVVEVMLTIQNADHLKGVNRLSLIMALLQDLLLKLNSNRIGQELANSAQGVLVNLLAHLRHAIEPDKLHRDAARQVIRPSSLQSAMRGICDSLLSSGTGSPMTRAFGYASLLYYLQLSKAYSKGDTPVISGEEESMHTPWAEYGDKDSLMYSNMMMLYGYGDVLVDMVCKDASSGHDISKMLALSLLDSVVAMDIQGNWLHHIKGKGYLRGLITSVHWEDESLQKSLLQIPEHLKSLYVYESKMAFLSRVATRPTGANELLTAKALLQISECKFIDMHPGYQDIAMETGFPSITARVAGKPTFMEYAGFVPSVADHYNQLFFPILRFMSSLLSSHGPNHKSAAVQVMKFIESHIDTFVAILHHGNKPTSLSRLQELAHVTMVIARAGVGYDTVIHDPTNFNPVCLVRVQTAMRGLLTTYWSIANWKAIIAGLMEDDPPSSAVLAKEALLLLEEISGNLAYYCRVDMTMGGEELTSQSGRIIFSPEVVQPVTHLGKMKGSLSLSLVLNHLKECTENFPTLSEELQKLERKLESETGLEDNENFMGGQTQSNLPIQERVLVLREETKRQIAAVHKERKLHSYIIENLLYILWRHIQFYLVYCKPSDFAEELIFKGTGGGGLRSLTGALAQEHSEKGVSFGRGGITHDISHLTERVTQVQLDKLREDLPAALSEQVFKKLMDLEESYIQKNPSVRVSFVQAVVRRLRRLIQQYAPDRPGRVL